MHRGGGKVGSLGGVRLGSSMFGPASLRRTEYLGTASTFCRGGKGIWGMGHRATFHVGCWRACVGPATCPLQICVHAKCVCARARVLRAEYTRGRHGQMIEAL